MIAGVVLAGTIAVGSGAIGAIPGPRRWQISPSPHAAESYTLAGVSCASATSCVAVGALPGVNYKGLIETWDGASWTVTPNPVVSPTLYLLSGVSCPDPTICVAVGKFLAPSGVEHTLVETRIDGEWSVTPSPNPDVSQGLNAVSCASATYCVAVGTSTDGERQRALVEEWNGTDWSVVPTPRPPHTPLMILNGVSCVTATNCVAAGSAASVDLGTQPLIERWNGTKWSIATVPYPDGIGNNRLFGVSCATGNRCVAVGSSAALNGPLIEMWDGTSWSIAERPNPGTGGNALSGVSCPGVTRCVATGSFNSDKRKERPRNLVEKWNGTAWTVVPSVSHLGQPDSLAGVSCPSTATCMAVGVTYASPVENAYILTGRA